MLTPEHLRQVREALATAQTGLQELDHAWVGVHTILSDKPDARVQAKRHDRLDVARRQCNNLHFRLRSALSLLDSPQAAEGAVDRALDYIRKAVEFANECGLPEPHFGDTAETQYDAVGVVSAELSRLRSLPAAPREDVSGYDKAVNALAPYLPDWVRYVAQSPDLFQSLIMFDCEPEASEKGEWWNAGLGAEQSEVMEFIAIPICTDWRTSLRRIEGGKVSAPPQQKEGE